MRRAFAASLLLLLFSQSSGAALAATGNGSVQTPDLEALIAPVQSAIVGSWLYAVVSGTTDRYGAMHAPPLHIQKPERNIDGLAVMRASRGLRPRPRPGKREVLQLPSRRELTSHERRRDPRAMRHSTMSPSAMGAQSSPGAPAFRLLGSAGAVSRSQSARPSGTGRSKGVKQALLSSGAGTGIEPWWTYEEQPIPGIGKAMLNVGTGNLVVSAMDVNVPEQGINLAFQRVYNSQSQHNVSGGDGGDPAIFGNGWTNDFDANVVYDGSLPTPTITVYDLNGTACTYTSNGNGGWTPCTGEYAQLAPAGTNGCTYTWTRPNGTVYVFQSDGGNTGICSGQNLTGHLVEIIGRNSNNYITFTYSWDSSGKKTSEDVTGIDAVHSDGDELVLTFGQVGTNNYNELSTIKRPDGAMLQYWYDNSGNLLEVDKPGNNSASGICSLPAFPHGSNCSNWQQGDLPETYAYTTGTSQMTEACGPRCTASGWGQTPEEGGSLTFQYTGSNLVQWQVQGILNFTPDDPTNTPLNSGAGNLNAWHSWNTTAFQYGSSGSSCTSSGSSGVTYMCDLDGHQTKWATDSSGRVTETDRFAVSVWITTDQWWDTSNNLVQTEDANGNVTKYGYDQYGNMVEMLQPGATDFAFGGSQNRSLAPLSFYSYDSYNNVVAYCDPVWTQSQGSTFQQNPTDSLCPSVVGTQSTPGTAHFVYTYDQTNEPYGCLTDMYKPLGYHTKIEYTNASGSNCGIGLPSSVQAASQITQFEGSSTGPRTPTQDFAYTQYGQLQQYDRGADTEPGQTQYKDDSWTLSYNPNGNHDNLNTEQTENDATVGTAMNSFTCYYPDGSIFYTETPSQHAADNSPPCPSTTSLLNGTGMPAAPAEATAHYYNHDGDEIEVISYKGCSTNTPCNNALTSCDSTVSSAPIVVTCKYYDGLDRLVETTEPYDGRSFADTGTKYEFYGFRWMNRYIYDLSLSGVEASLSISDKVSSTQTFKAYGNLYKTQEYLPQLSYMHGCYANTDDCNKPSGGQYSSASWNDVRGTSFDSLDRPVNKYELAYGTGQVAPVTSNTYDLPTQYGELSFVVNAVGQTTTYTYDEIARVQNVMFSGGNPADPRSYQYDPDGRTASIADTSLRTSFGQISYTYDADGNESSVTEPTSAQNASYKGSSFICYEYYPDGLRKFLTVDDADNTHAPSSGLTPGNCQGSGSKTNGGISQYRIFSYAYWGDGRLAEQYVSWGYWSTAGTNGGPAQFVWQYHPSGRENTENDPLTNQKAYDAYYTLPTQNPPSCTPTNSCIQLAAKTYTYDAYGRVSGLTLPGQYQESPASGSTSLVYDEEDELAGFAAGLSGQQSVTRSLELNVRGEVLEDGWGGTGSAQAETQSANGTQVGIGDSVTGSPVQVPPTTIEYDLRSGMVTCSTDPLFASHYETDPTTVYPWVIQYDQAGRQIASGWDESAGVGNGGVGDTTCKSGASGLGQTTYDTENHVLSTSSASDSETATWGPDGRQRITTDSSNGTETAHWDGDTLLVATGGASNPSPVLYVGKSATMDSAGDINVYDRDQTGAEVSSHGLFVNWNTQSPEMGWMKNNGYWVDGWSVGSVRTVTVQKSGQQVTAQMFQGTCNGVFYNGNQQTYVNCPAALAQFAMTRADGYTMVGGIVQGARTYDSTSGQWLTPDAYAGDANDPMSQKPFIWNNNNSVEFNDPSGYCADTPGQPNPSGCLGGVDWNLNMNFGKALDNLLWTVVTSIVFPAKPALSIPQISRALAGASSLRVIGKFEIGGGYVEYAAQIGGRVWSMAEKTWNGMTDAQRWASNQAFLDQGIKEGATFVIAPGKWGQYTVKEVNYLLDHGYDFTEGEDGAGVLTPKANPNPQPQPLFYDSQTAP